MKFFSTFLLSASIAFTACDKSAIIKPEQGTLPVTTAIKTGEWMINTYKENGANMSSGFGVTMIKFASDKTLTATKDGNLYNGTWSETNTGGNNVFTINIISADAHLKKANGAWKVTGITEYFIDVKDGNATVSNTMNLMKH